MKFIACLATIILSLLLSLTASTAYAQEFALVREQSSFVPVITRLLKLFMDLEMTLDKSVRQADHVKIDELLLEDFEQRNGAYPGIPTPREVWLQQYATHAKDIPSFNVEQMAAHAFGNMVLLSFKWIQPNTAGLFVVDVWKQQGETWKLAVRYINPAGPDTVNIPGTPK